MRVPGALLAGVDPWAGAGSWAACQWPTCGRGSAPSGDRPGPRTQRWWKDSRSCKMLYTCRSEPLNGSLHHNYFESWNSSSWRQWLGRPVHRFLLWQMTWNQSPLLFIQLTHALHSSVCHDGLRPVSAWRERNWPPSPKLKAPVSSSSWHLGSCSSSITCLHSICLSFLFFPKWRNPLMLLCKSNTSHWSRKCQECRKR